MRIKNFTFFFFLLLFYQLHAQIQIESFNDVVDKYNNYYLLEPETFYTQINKEKYFQGESVWFKTYVYNTRNSSPYIATKNVHVGLYNGNGEEIEKKIFYAEDGATFGHFIIDQKITPGIYYIKTTSIWMKNFNEDRSFVRSFEVMSVSQEEELKTDIEVMDYDIKILSEGGHILANTTNTFGFKIINSKGNGEKIVSGSIVCDDKIITTFKNNKLGFGKFKFKVENGKNYKASFKLENGEVLTKTIDNTEPLGVILSAENVFSNTYLSINLKTNKASLSNLLNKTYHLTLNRDGFLKEIDFQFKPNQFDYLIRIKKELMVSGVNILTLFNDKGQAISERVLFNPNGLKIESLPKAKIYKEKDSTVIKYKLTKDILGNKGSLSVSVLPNQTKAYNKKTSILSAFLLKPYIKGKVEKPDFYFNELDREGLYNLDLLLITQGWSRYNWNTIFYKSQYPLNDFEIGFNLKGKINNHRHNPKEHLVLLSKANSIRLEAKLKEDNSFEFKNLFIADSSDIQFSLKKNRQTIPSVYYVITPAIKKDSVRIINKTDYNYGRFENVNKSNTDFVYKNPVILDTVNLFETVKKEKTKNIFLPGNFYAKNISLSNTKRYSPGTLLIDVINDNGFDVIYYDFDNIVIKNRRLPQATLGGNALPPPAVFIDNVKQPDFSFLASLRINEVEDISISQHGSLIGSDGVAGVIQVFLKNEFKNSQKSKFNSKITDFGYASQKEFYNPLYDIENNETYLDYGVIHWNPSIKTNQDGDIHFAIPNTKLEGVNLYIEGMGEDGILLSKTETVILN